MSSTPHAALLRKLVVQQLESLHRSGVTQIRRGKLPQLDTTHPATGTGPVTGTPPGGPPEPAMPGASGLPAPSPLLASPPIPDTTRPTQIGDSDAAQPGTPSPVADTADRGDLGKTFSPADRLPPAEDQTPAPVHINPPPGGAFEDSEMAKRSLEQRRAELAVLQQQVANCTRCEHLACARTNTVFGVGNIRPRLVFLGEAPGADEDRLGEPFVGRAGQLLTDIIQNEKAMNLRRSDVYILNVLKCRPPNNRTPTDEEIENCREYLERQLELLQPEFICCLGATAVRALLHRTQSLGSLRGKWFDYRGARVIVTYHPSYLLRNPAAKKDTWQDIQLLMREMGLPIRK